MNNNKLSLAICGLGGFASRRILPILTLCDNIDLTAIIHRSDRSEDPILNGIQVYDSLEAFLDTTPCGAVYITTPNYLHAQQSLQCLSAGLHILCEKPMATTSIDCKKMIRTATELGLHLQIGHQLRYSPALKLARSWIHDEKIGKILDIQIVFNYDLPISNRPWAYRPELAGGGSLMDAGIHCIDTIRFLIGGPVVLLEAKTDRDLYADGLERIADCSFITGDVNSYISVNAKTSYATILTISGNNGEIVINNFAACWGMVNVKLYAFHLGPVIKEEWVDVSTIYADQIRSFADSVAKSEISYSQAIDAAENVRIVEGLYSISQSWI